MLDTNQIEQVRGVDAYDIDGEKIGKVGEIYVDDNTGRPEWATINTGLFGTSESFVPLAEASFTDEHLQVPYEKAKVKDAPNLASDGHLSPDEERELYRYYGVAYDDYQDSVMARGQDTSGREADTGFTSQAKSGTDDAMTRSEERVDVGTESREAGRARLRKYVVTENVTETVPVRKEKAVVEREPITSDNVDEATSGPDMSEAEHEVTLKEERPVVTKTTEPVERVRLGTEKTTGEETVTEEVRKERIEAEGDVSDSSSRKRR